MLATDLTRRSMFWMVAGGVLAPASAKVTGDEVLYVGGTIASLPEATEGFVDLQHEEVWRRVGVAIVISVWALFSKKRKHFLTIGFDDAEGKPQGVVLEVAKGRPKTFITILEVRSGKKVEYESEEAKKHVHG